MGKLKQFLAANHIAVILVFGFIILFILLAPFPAPYNVRYAFNRLTKNPTFVCKDGVYSFAVKRGGACSSHGGVKGRVQ